MAEATQYTFELREITIALIRLQGLKTGVWQVGFEMGLGAGQFNANGEEVRPGAFMQITRLQLMQTPPGAPRLSYSVDAATLEPQAKSSPTLR